MRGQRLRHNVSIMKPVRTRTDLGESLEDSWLKIADCPAAVTPVSVADRMRADQPVSDITHRIRLWWFEGLTHTHRLVMDGRTFEIKGILNLDERNKVMELMCTEQAATI
jgi:SPP1 family predicted phage head-tail adaptor